MHALKPSTQDSLYLDKSDVEALLQHADITSLYEPRLTRIHRFVYLALLTGGRAIEIRYLTWSRVDLVNRIIHYREPTHLGAKPNHAWVRICDNLLPMLSLAYHERTTTLVLDNDHHIDAEWQAFTEGTDWTDVQLSDLRHSYVTPL